MQFQVTVRNAQTAKIIERLLYEDRSEAEDRVGNWKTSYGESVWSKKFKIEIKEVG